MTRIAVTCSLALLLTLGTAAPCFAEADAPADSLTDEQLGTLLEKGMSLIKSGAPGEAIVQAFDPIIDHYEKAYAAEPRQVYSANSMMETIMYAALNSAAEKDNPNPRGSIVIDGTWVNALHLKGYALVDLRRMDEAEAAFKRATELAPLNGSVWAELGNVYQDAKKWDDAMAAYQQAETSADMTLEGDARKKLLARALRGEAFVLTERGQLDESEKLYKRCLKMDRNDASAKHELEYIRQLRQHPLHPASP